MGIDTSGISQQFGFDSKSGIKNWLKGNELVTGTTRAVRDNLDDKKTIVWAAIPQCNSFGMLKESYLRLNPKFSNIDSEVLEGKVRAWMLQSDIPECRLSLRERCTHDPTLQTGVPKCHMLHEMVAPTIELLFTEYENLDAIGRLKMGTDLIPAYVVKFRIEMQLLEEGMTVFTAKGPVSNSLLKEARETSKLISKLHAELDLKNNPKKTPKKIKKHADKLTS